MGKFINNKASRKLGNSNTNTNRTVKRKDVKKSSWLRNAADSAKNLSVDIIKELSPTIVSSFQDNKTFVETNYTKVVGSDYQNIKDIHKNSKLLLSNVLKEIKTGEIYSQRQKNESMSKEMKGLGFDIDMNDFNMDFDDIFDDDGEFSDEDNGGGFEDFNNINNVTNINIDQSTDVSTTSKVMGESASAIMQGQALSTATIASGLDGLLKFQNENTIKFYESVENNFKVVSDSLSNLEKLSSIGTKIQLEKTNSRYEENITDLLNDTGINLEKYFNKFQENMGDGGMMSTMFDGIKGKIEAAVVNPLGTLLKSVGVGALKKTKVGKELVGMNNVMNDLPRFFNNFLMNNKDGGGKLGALFSTIFDAVGVDTSKGTSLSKAKVKENVSQKFDTETKTAITQVIPTYLAKILSTLSTDEREQQGIFYNYKTGQYTTTDEEYKIYKLKQNKIIDKNSELEGIKSSLASDFKGEENEKLIQELLRNLVKSGKVSDSKEVSDYFGKDTIESVDHRKLKAITENYSKLMEDVDNQFNYTNSILRANQEQRNLVNETSNNTGMNYKYNSNNTASTLADLERDDEQSNVELYKNAKKQEKYGSSHNTKSERLFGKFFTSAKFKINKKGNGKIDKGIDSVLGSINEVRNIFGMEEITREGFDELINGMESNADSRSKNAKNKRGNMFDSDMRNFEPDKMINGEYKEDSPGYGMMQLLRKASGLSTDESEKKSKVENKISDLRKANPLLDVTYDIKDILKNIDRKVEEPNVTTKSKIDSDKKLVDKNGEPLYKKDGTHAMGLNKVPFDGYIAEVHKDEAILTPMQAKAWREGQSNLSTATGTNQMNNGFGEDSILLLHDISTKLDGIELLNMTMSEFNSNFLVYANGGIPDGTIHDKFAAPFKYASETFDKVKDRLSKTKQGIGDKISRFRERKNKGFIKDRLDSFKEKMKGKKDKWDSGKDARMLRNEEIRKGMSDKAGNLS